MICSKHRAIARSEEHGWPLCFRCFDEAAERAIMVAQERKLAEMRLSSANALMRRLNGR